MKRRYCDLDAAAKQRYDDILPGLVDDPPFVPGRDTDGQKLTLSACTLKAYTSLDGYNFSIQGWVSNILRILSLGEVSLLLADVKQSQKLIQQLLSTPG